MKYRVSFGECAVEDGLCIEHPNQLGIKVEKDEIHWQTYSVALKMCHSPNRNISKVGM